MNDNFRRSRISFKLNWYSSSVNSPLHVPVFFAVHAPLYHHPHPSFGKKHKTETIQLNITLCWCNQTAKFLYSVIIISCEQTFCLKIQRKAPKSFSLEHHFLIQTNHHFVRRQHPYFSTRWSFPKSSQENIPVIQSWIKISYWGSHAKRSVHLQLALGRLGFPFIFRWAHPAQW